MKIQNFIGGEFCEPLSKKYFENINPSRGKVYSWVPDSDNRDIDTAVAAAENAFPSWSKTPAAERSRWLSKFAQGILQKLDSLAMAESTDNGKPLKLATSVDIPRSAKNFQFFADYLSTLHGEKFETSSKVLNYTEYSPLGVVGCISPWNLPLYLLTWKIAPALAAGNTVVAKPSEITPMTAYLLCEIAKEIGFPPGVLNMIHGKGPSAGGPLCTHPRVKAISFTGSTQTGRWIAQNVSAQFKKVSLEMGGKNPNIIFADANYEKALQTTVRSSFSNQGQICLCGSRIFIEESIYEKFKKDLILETQKLKIGDPLLEDTDFGAVVSKDHQNKVLSYIEKARSEGGRILCGGEKLKLTGDLAEGFFIAPTLIEGLPSSSPVNQEEIFGPVATLIPFRNEGELLQMANSTQYGLAASIWTQDSVKAKRIASQLESGIVWVNTWMERDLRTPFGGVKESGVGREGGLEALKFFSEVKNICVESE